MSKAIDDLMQEHQVIRSALRILQKAVIMIKKNSEVSPDDLNTMIAVYSFLSSALLAAHCFLRNAVLDECLECG